MFPRPDQDPGLEGPGLAPGIVEITEMIVVLPDLHTKVLGVHYPVILMIMKTVIPEVCLGSPGPDPGLKMDLVETNTSGNMIDLTLDPRDVTGDLPHQTSEEVNILRFHVIFTGKL